uniref:CD99 antigen-like protein 2 n=1 Tax=Homo sapiens TaxID=9606 RepID=B4DHP9_HUMAN|nr:unnamed protein product [Homo sapiens]
MVAWRSAFLVCLAFSLATLVQRGSGDFDDFNLEDAVKETSSVKQPWDHTTTTTTNRPGTTRAPAKPPGSGLDLADALDDQDDGRRKPGIGGRERWNHVTTTTKRPVTTRAPANTLGNDFDLADALDDRNDRDDGRRPNQPGSEGPVQLQACTMVPPLVTRLPPPLHLDPQLLCCSVPSAPCWSEFPG